MAGYWPSSFLGALWTEKESRSKNKKKKKEKKERTRNGGNI